MALFHPIYNITIKFVPLRFVKAWEEQGFIAFPSIQLGRAL